MSNEYFNAYSPQGVPVSADTGWTYFNSLPTTNVNTMNNPTAMNQSFAQAYTPQGAPMQADSYWNLIPTGNSKGNPNTSSNTGFGNNKDTWNLGLNAVTGLGNLYFTNKQLGIAEDQLGIQKANLANQANQFNYTLEKDANRRARYSGIQGGDKTAFINEYFDKYGARGTI